jgi:nucleoside-diphosphate-sugar epimerase
MRALVVGGTGPTGPFIVNGLLDRGYNVAIFHRGTHEIPEIPPCVEHIHGDPHFRETIDEALRGRDFDLVVATYGRLRHVAEALVNRTDRLIAVGGVAVYRGFKEPERLAPAGLPVPTREDAQLVVDEEEPRFCRLLTITEDAVRRAHPTATIFRYPYVYGPYQLVPREWCVIRRILDRRSYIIVPDGGLTLASHGYAENLAHAVLLAVDQPKVSQGQIYNCGDEQTLTLRQTVEIIAAAMNSSIEIVNFPDEVAIPARAIRLREHSYHWMMDITKLKSELGYRDVLPVQEALPKTVRWYLQNPPERDGEIEQRLADPFDYDMEDRLVEIQRDAVNRMKQVGLATQKPRPHPYAHPKFPGERRDHRAR